MKRKAKDIARSKKRRKVGELISKYSDAGLYGSSTVNPGENRTWSQYGTDMAAGASGAMLGYISGNVPGAIVGGHYGNRLSQFKRHKGELHLFDQEKTIVTPLMSSSYGGKLRKSVGKSTNRVRSKYQANGGVVIEETHGSVQDADVVGVGHITWHMYAVMRSIFYALMRKLFVKAGVIIQTPYEELRIVNLSDSGPSGFKILWSMQDAAGATTTGSYVIPNDATLESLYGATGLIAVLQNMLTEKNPANLERVMLMSSTDNVVSQIILRQQRISLTVNTHTVIQNRTKSSSGLTGTDVVDAQPVKGPIFQFTGVPKTKEISPVALNIVPFNGTMLFRKSQLAGSDVAAWSEPPVKSSFYNASKGSYCRLSPGVLKDMEVSKTWNGPFHTIMNRWRITYSSTTIGACPGISQMAFLEEELNSGSANLISVSYETQHTVGCNLTTVKAPNMQPYYATTILNNIPA